jgi:hypothetical protein
LREVRDGINGVLLAKELTVISTGQYQGATLKEAPQCFDLNAVTTRKLNHAGQCFPTRN